MGAMGERSVRVRGKGGFSRVVASPGSQGQDADRKPSGQAFACPINLAIFRVCSVSH